MGVGMIDYKVVLNWNWIS